MRKTLTTAATIVAMAAAFAAVAAGRTDSATQRVRIEATGADPFAFVLRPMSQGRVRRDTGPMTSCCWSTWHVIRAGARLAVTNPRLTFARAQGTLTIRNRIEWVDLPDGWAVVTGTWKVVGGTGTYAGLSGHGRVGGVMAADRYIRLRLFGSVGSK
jgi:hypothetical protein